MRSIEGGSGASCVALGSVVAAVWLAGRGILNGRGRVSVACDGCFGGQTVEGCVARQDVGEGEDE
jgi:hypothetical protein